jgi:hypothetical protein
MVRNDGGRLPHRPSLDFERPSKSTRLIKNGQKWDCLKGEIQQIYQGKGETLATTMQTIEREHGFQARSGTAVTCYA